jgi:hypothetical protein
MCRSCVARYIDMTFPLAEACETCRAESPSGQPWLLGSLKKFQLACQYATPRCKKRMLTGGRDGRNAATTRAPTPQQELAIILHDGQLRDHRTLADRAVRRPTPQRPAAAATVVAGDVGQSLKPESLMKLDLAWASHVTTPPQIADGRSSFGPSVADAKASCAAR